MYVENIIGNLKEYWKMVQICPSYDQKFSWFLFFIVRLSYIYEYLPTAVAGKVKQSLRPSVRPFASILSIEPTDLWTWDFVRK